MDIFFVGKLHLQVHFLTYQTNFLMRDVFLIDSSLILENMLHFRLRHLHETLLINEDKHYYKLVLERKLKHYQFVFISVQPFQTS